MDRTGIGSARNDPVEGIDLAHQMALAQSADRRIAAHRADCGQIETDQGHARTHPRRHRRGFDPGVSPANHNDIELLHLARALAQVCFT